MNYSDVGYAKWQERATLQIEVAYLLREVEGGRLLRNLKDPPNRPGLELLKSL